MELVLNRFNHENLNQIRDVMVKQYLNNENVNIKKYMICTKDDKFVYKISREELSEEQKEHIKDMFNELKSNYKVLFIGSYFPIKQLKMLNEEYGNIEHFVDVYYYEEGKIEQKLVDFAKHFLSNFEGEYRKLDYKREYKNLLNIDVFGFCKFDRLVDMNNCLYLEFDQEIHTSKYDVMSELIYERMKVSCDDMRYKVYDLDIDNMNRISKGISPVKFFDHDDYKSVIAFCNISMGLPTMNLRNISRFIKGFNKEYYNLKFLESYISEYEKIKSSYYFHRVFETELEAKCFGIYLGSENVKFLVHNKTVYYENFAEIEPIELEEVKFILTKIYSNVGKIAQRDLNKIDLESLLNIYNHDGHLISYKHEINHVNPMNNKVLEMDYYDRKDNTFMGIFREFTLDGLYPLDSKYDKANLKELPDHDIKISEGSIYCGDRLLISNFFINDIKRLENNLKKLWKKGYLVNTFGLMNYMYNNDILEQTIELPVWFTLKNSNEENFFRFVENLLS